MARHDNNYGAGGANHDEFGELPEKRIENLNGVDITPKMPPLPGSLNDMIISYFVEQGKKPTKLIYPGPQSYTTSVGRIITGIGFVSLDLYNIPNAPEARLE